MGWKKSLNQQQFKNTIRTGVTLVDFNAPWCAPCRVQKPIVDELEKLYDGKASILEINVDGNQESAMELGITSIPTLIIYKNGVEIERFVGLQSVEVLSDAIDKALEVHTKKEEPHGQNV
ncbi:MAG: thiol reductase thioredoxin [Deltaproteobacteria bacterium]|nr:thiol reductase thioredoxin [Deltaproteobacteria bacterium]